MTLDRTRLVLDYGVESSIVDNLKKSPTLPGLSNMPRARSSTRRAKAVADRPLVVTVKCSPSGPGEPGAARVDGPNFTDVIKQIEEI
jgi:hypothetical protein